MRVLFNAWMSVLLSGLVALVLAGNTVRGDEFGSRYDQPTASPAAEQGAVSGSNVAALQSEVNSAAPQSGAPATTQSIVSTETGNSASGGESEKDWWRFHYFYRYHYYYRPVYYTYYYYRPVYYSYGGPCYYYWDEAGKRHDGTDPAKLRDDLAGDNR